MSNLPVISPGLCWLCTMCEHMAEAHSRGLDACGLTDCGGPLQAKTFPKYKGPLEGHTTDFCFVCGKPSKFVLNLEDIGDIGLCEGHKKYMLDNPEDDG